MQKGILLLIITTVLLSSCKPGQKPPADTQKPAVSLNKGVILVDYREESKVDVFIDGDIFTSYIYPSELEKPVLYPVRTAEGTAVTRGYPLEPRAGERIDHPHQVGAWFSFGDVNGFDFWTNSRDMPEDSEAGLGRIIHRGVKRAESREALGVLEVAADWQVPGKDGSWHTLLQEKTIYEFSGDEHTRTIDRITQLTAQEDEVVFTDNNEGLFAIRVARELEHPSDEPQVLTDAKGNAEEVKKVDNKGVQGHFLNSEGIEGTEAWGKKARWVSLSSKIAEEDISITLFDHPDNAGYPSYWHARGYGLLSVNNLGAKVFDDNAEPILIKLTPGEPIVFKHRMHITSGSHATAAQLEKIFEDFSQK
ncbi:PmoA family protein [Bacteroidota bacterium]